jgi:hypothetical protein
MRPKMNIVNNFGTLYIYDSFDNTNSFKKKPNLVFNLNIYSQLSLKPI